MFVLFIYFKYREVNRYFFHLEVEYFLGYFGSGPPPEVIFSLYIFLLLSFELLELK